MIRPTASTITDDQLDALYEGLERLEGLHKPFEDEFGGFYASTCIECGENAPCNTVKTIREIRQRSMQ